MTESRDDRFEARREAATLLGVDIERLSPADGLRVDMVSALRLVIDAEQASVLSGSSADLGKLNVAVQSLIALLPGRELPEPESSQHDDREAATAPLLKLFRSMHEQVHTLTTENAELRAALGLKGFPQSGEMFKAAITPPTSDIVPPGERAECDAGPRPGPDDPAPRSTRVIEAKAVPAAAPAPEPWQDWLDRGGYGGPGHDRWSDNRR